MKRFLLLATLFMALVGTAAAQGSFSSRVRIEYEKVVYVQQQYRELYPEWFDEFKDRIPNKVVNTYELVGDTTHSLFRQLKEAVLPPNTWYEEIGNNNVVYQHYGQGRTVAQKPVAEETFLVEDSLLNIRWRLTADTRTIAGYDCRKAIGILDDTMAIFAFYTDELLVPGGPESIHGLPGTILGLGIPRLHSTWFATKVEVNGVNIAAVKPATKGKKVTREQMVTQLDAVLKNWGKYGSKLRMNFLF